MTDETPEVRDARIRATSALLSGVLRELPRPGDAGMVLADCLLWLMENSEKVDTREKAVAALDAIRDGALKMWDFKRKQSVWHH